MIVQCKKRSVVVGGKRTSISLEDEFWVALNMLVIAQSTSLREFLTRISLQPTANLSSSVRIAVLKHYQYMAQGTIPPSARTESIAHVIPFRRQAGAKFLRT